jgi:hypothetical protein
MRASLLTTGFVVAAACTASQATQRLDMPPSGDPGGDLAAVGETAGKQLVYRCGDPALNDQLTSGGERLTSWAPCWDTVEEAELVRSGRAIPRSAALAEAELVSCKGISERELAHSPFAHKQAIEAIIPHREAGQLRGVRVVFKAVPGLTADWMRRAIACQRARHEVLSTPSYLLDDPTLVDGADIAVYRQPGGKIEVVVATQDSHAAQLALSRAQELLREQAALR